LIKFGIRVMGGAATVMFFIPFAIAKSADAL
jgi:hypothetical protein